MRKILLTVLAASGLVWGAAAAHAEDLLDTYRQALRSDPQLRAAEAAFKATLENRPQSKAGLLPNIGLSGSVSRTERRDQIEDSTLYYTSKSYDLQLTQPLYRRDRWIQLEQADSQIAQADAQFNSARQGLIVRVAQAYFNLLRAQDNLSFAQAEKKAIFQQLRQTKQRFEVGLTAITDVREAQARYDLSVSREIAAQNQVQVAQEALRELTGQAPGELVPLSEKMPLVMPQPADIKKWVKTALQQNLEVLAAEAGAQVARKEIERRRSGHYPTLDLTADYGYDDTNFGGFRPSRADTGTVGVQLNIPIYQGGLITSQTRQAAHLLSQAQDQLDQQRRATVRNTRSAYLNVDAGISQVKALKQSVISSETALKATEAGFEVGTRTAVDVLNSQQELFGARRDYASARYDYILSTLQLKQAAGTLNEQDVQRVNEWLKGGQ
jgi:outer membrane protein